MNADVADDEVSASELRQWLYCPRVVWMGRQFGSNRPTSAMMKVGIDEEAERRRLEARRTFDQYGIEAIARRNQIPVWSDDLGIRGLVDTLLELTATSLEEGTERHQENGPSQMFVPVEFKTTMRADQRQNVLQLVAYGMCIEEMTGTPVDYAFLVLLPSEEVIRQPLGPRVRRTVSSVAEDVRAALASEEMPRATAVRGRCQSCEFKHFCNDVW